MKQLISITSAIIISMSIIGCVTADRQEGVKLDAIIKRYTEEKKRLDPYWATYYGVEENLAKFGDYLSDAYHAREKKLYADALTALKAVNFSNLSPADRTNYLLFKGDMEVSLKKFDYPFEYLAFNQMGNRLREYIDDSSPGLTYFPFDSLKHYADFIKRSEGFPAFVDIQIENLRNGAKAGYVLNCTVAKSAIRTYQEALTTDVEKNPFFRPVLNVPEKFSKDDVERLKDDFRKMIATNILPAFQKFDRFYRAEYLPKCRQSYGIGRLPQGERMYAHQILANTDLNRPAKEIHEIGLREVRRIRGEMDSIRKTLGHKGPLNAFLKSLVSDKTHFFNSSEDLFAAFRQYESFVSTKVGEYFSLIPKTKFELVQSENPEDAAASYRQPSDSQPIGRFVVNTHNLRGVPKYGVQTLFIHEAIPGHHFQLAIQYEMKSALSEYRRKLFNSTAFVEGWALYTEQLAREVGLISDPLQKLGSLNDEMLRAVRLVVDTGIHHFHWSRTKAIAYMKENLATDIRDIEIEADRYSVWPGQALGYKVGQIKILELREKARNALGGRFDIRDFHRVVIGSGMVSLPVLEAHVDAYLKAM